MRWPLAAALALAPTLAHAQVQVGGNIGVRMRNDGDNFVRGVQLEAMLVHPAGRYSHWLNLAIVQMKNHTSTGGIVRENSIEGTVLLHRLFAAGIGGAIGPVLSYGTGCASGGAGGVGYGKVGCVVSFAEKGTVRPGYALQLDWAKANARGAVFRAGVRAVGHTVGSGSKTPKPGAWAGFTLPLGSAP